MPSNNTMTGVQKLEFVKLCYDRMEEAGQLLEKLTATAERTTCQINEVKVKTNDGTNWTEEHTLRMIEAREYYATTINEYIEALSEANGVLHGLPEPKWISLLSGRYINNLSWGEIASSTKQSLRNCMRLHKEALKWIEESARD